MIRTLLGKSKNLKDVTHAVEDFVEKIVQYGEKQLMIMKPTKETWVEIKGLGCKVPEGSPMIDYYTKAGYKLGEKITVTTKDTFATAKDGSIDRLTTVLQPFGHSGKVEKTTHFVKNFGTGNARQSSLYSTPIHQVYTPSQYKVPIC